jgi:hypothetical protein
MKTRQGAYLSRVRAWMLTMFPDHNPVGFACLRAVAGCQAQLEHKDWVTERFEDWSADNVHVPLQVIISLDDAACLTVFPASHIITPDTDTPQAIPPCTVTFGRNTGIVFRGDLVHAGAQYPTDHHRVFFYLVPNGTLRPVDETYVYGQTPYEAAILGMKTVRDCDQ